MASIAEVEIIPLANPVPNPKDLDGTTETVIVRITDENGLSGIGECDAPALVVKAFLEMPTQHLWSSNASEILIGADPVETVALWERLYEGTIYPGRRGVGIHALSAVDIALHDLAGKQLPDHQRAVSVDGAAGSDPLPRSRCRRARRACSARSGRAGARA